MASAAVRQRQRRRLRAGRGGAGAPGPGGARPGLVPHRRGQMLAPSAFGYFIGVAGTEYLRFVRENTSYVGAHTNILVPDPARFHWLTYTGIRQNRSYFTQLVLAGAAQA